jgi:hypothetical protein
MRQKLLGSLKEELHLTPKERKVLLSSDEMDSDITSSSSSRHEAEMRMVKKATAKGDSLELFERFKEDFFSGIGKLNRMQTISEVLLKDQSNSKLAVSITESVRFIEESAYAKLVKHLKDRIRVFDSPLEN